MKLQSPLPYMLLFTAMILCFAGQSMGDSNGFFRAVPFDSPPRGVLRLTNNSYYSKIQANSVLQQDYAVTKSNILSSITGFELGITNYLALTGTVPYYADMFKQAGKKGEKTGGGDIAAGLRLSYTPEKSMFRGVSFGTRYQIPERMLYGQEPLGFRLFTSGKPGLSFELSTGFGMKFLETYASTSLITFPNATQPETLYQSDFFYETGFGYRGVGNPDANGYAPSLFHDQLHLNFGALLPVKPWLSAIVEYSNISFFSGPKRESISLLSPGLRLGSVERINASIGMDFALSGPVPDKTFLFRVTIPSFSKKSFLKTREIIDSLRRVPGQGEKARAQNNFVAVNEFVKSDFTYLYEKELRDTFEKQLQSMGVLNVVPGSQVDDIMKQRDLVPLPEKPSQLGVRLGASHLITTEIFEYSISRESGFTIPLVVGFPGTHFTIRARASVVDLMTGLRHDLGIITATVVKPRGVRFFPVGTSSDIVYLSEPERRIVERQLIDQWVTSFNQQVTDRIYLFDWDPKRIIVRGEEETKG
ncbi:hypothetical protein ACFL47_07400 [Candidatus Latescibacterota bacterium]